jgi:PLP dependent protein
MFKVWFRKTAIQFQYSMPLASVNVYENALLQTKDRIQRTCGATLRQPGTVRLLAVSKLHPAEAVRALYAAGQRAFGENYVQEGVDKILALSDLPDIEWHLIGPLQSNKTRDVAAHFAWVHSLDREKLAQRLNDHRPAHLPPLNVCVQVNVSGEASKSGVMPAEAPALLAAVAALPRLKLRGVMGMPEPGIGEAATRAQFRLLRELFNAHPGLDTLSMGMSDDLEWAIAEGSTLVRIGTALFGKRPT